MVSKNNQWQKLQKESKILHYGLRKSSIGVVSALIGLSFMGLNVTNANADTTVTTNTANVAGLNTKQEASASPNNNIKLNPAVTKEDPATSGQTNLSTPTNAISFDNDQELQNKFGDVNNQIKDNPLGKAAAFHIFANNTSINTDVNGNIATNTLNNGPEFGTRSNFHNYTTGDIYYLNHTKQVGTNAFRTGNNYVVIGDNSNVEIKGNQVFINGTRLDHLDAKDLHIIKNYINFKEEFNKLQNTSDLLTSASPTENVKIDLDSDMNNRYIDLSPVKNKKIIIINISSNYLEQPQPITIKGLSHQDDGPLVVLNVISNKDTLNLGVSTKFIYDDNRTVNSGEGHEEPNHVLWNFGNKISELNITGGNLLGSLLAPNAKVNTGVNVDGNIVANTVNINGGESHRWDLRTPEFVADLPDTPSTSTPSKPHHPHHWWEEILVPNHPHTPDSSANPGSDNPNSDSDTPNSSANPGSDNPNSDSDTPDSSANPGSDNPNSDSEAPANSTIPGSIAKPSTGVSNNSNSDVASNITSEATNNVTPVASQTTNNKRLPQTGNQKSRLGILGLITTSLLVALSINRRKNY